jgi:hypothetical protein
MVVDVRILRVSEWRPFTDEGIHRVNCEVTLDQKFRDDEAKLVIQLADGRNLIATLLWAVNDSLTLQEGVSARFAMQFPCKSEDEFSQLGITGVHATIYTRDYPPQ